MSSLIQFSTQKENFDICHEGQRGIENEDNLKIKVKKQKHG